MEDKTNRIVILGGSFNPPTVAHRRLLCTAMDGVGAERGIFVPSNDAYVMKKMAKSDYPSEVLWSPVWKVWHRCWRKRKGYL